MAPVAHNYPLLGLLSCDGTRLAVSCMQCRTSPAVLRLGAGGKARPYEAAL